MAPTADSLHALLDQFRAGVDDAATGEWHKEARAAHIAEHVATLHMNVDQLFDTNPPADRPAPVPTVDTAAAAAAEIADLRAQLAAAQTATPVDPAVPTA